MLVADADLLLKKNTIGWWLVDGTNLVQYERKVLLAGIDKQDKQIHNNSKCKSQIIQ
jgi:hypothetical protein